MTQTEAEKMIIDAVRRIQKLSGREDSETTRSTRPISDIEGFDSLNGVEITIEIEDALGVDFDFNNVLVDDKEVLTIAEAAEKLLKWISLNKKRPNTKEK